MPKEPPSITYPADQPRAMTPGALEFEDTKKRWHAFIPSGAPYELPVPNENGTWHPSTMPKQTLTFKNGCRVVYVNIALAMRLLPNAAHQW